MILNSTYVGGGDGTIKQYQALDHSVQVFCESLPAQLVEALLSGDLSLDHATADESSFKTGSAPSNVRDPQSPQAERRRRPRQSKEEIGLALRRASLGKATGMVFEVVECTYTVVAKGQREKTLVDGVSARLEPGQVLALLGPSGAGKTTLLSMLTLQRGSGRAHGKVLLNGQPFTPALYRQHAAYVAQHDQVSSQCIRSCAALSLPTHS